MPSSNRRGNGDPKQLNRQDTKTRHLFQSWRPGAWAVKNWRFDRAEGSRLSLPLLQASRQLIERVAGLTGDGGGKSHRLGRRELF